MTLIEYIEKLKNNPAFMKNVTSWQVVPERKARYGEFPENLDLRVKQTLHERGIDAVVARMNLAFKTPLRSGDSFASRLALRKEGIKYVFVQDIFRLPDNKPVLRSTVEAVCLINGRLSDCEELNTVFAKYFKD